MRLDDFERSAIVRSIVEIDPSAEVWLIGSRTIDSAKGGDIDLLVISSRIGFSEKLDLLIALKTVLSDQKIDLRIVSPEHRATDAFAAAVLPAAVRL